MFWTLEEGHWFVSLYNDYGDSQTVELVMSMSESDSASLCHNNCNGRGNCVLGKCVCNPGYGGNHCQIGIKCNGSSVTMFFIFAFSGTCPILCNGNGNYKFGECHCHPGWKGKECQLRHDECEVSDCSGHGHCQEGRCKCLTGFTGENCQKGVML